MRCKKKVEIKDSIEGRNKNGLKIATGTCPDCGTKVYVILGK